MPAHWDQPEPVGQQQSAHQEQSALAPAMEKRRQTRTSSTRRREARQSANAANDSTIFLSPVGHSAEAAYPNFHTLIWNAPFWCFKGSLEQAQWHRFAGAVDSRTSLVLDRFVMPATSGCVALRTSIGLRALRILDRLAHGSWLPDDLGLGCRESLDDIRRDITPAYEARTSRPSHVVIGASQRGTRVPRAKAFIRFDTD